MKSVLARLGRGARRIGVPLAVTVGALVALVLTRHRPAPPDFSGTDVVRVGVSQGASIPGYLDAARSRLAALGAGTAVFALVSFTGYLPPDAVGPVLAGAEPFRVYTRVPLPGTQTAIISIPVARLPEDLIAGMDAEARRRAEVAARTGDPVASTEADQYRQHCACAYAAVVRADAATLSVFAGRPSVRGVDPAPEVTRLERAVFLPPLPEQAGTAGPPRQSGTGGSLGAMAASPTTGSLRLSP